MRKKQQVVKRISLDTARALLKDMRVMSLKKTGSRHGIRNYDTIPRLVGRTFEREGRKVPRLVEKHTDGSTAAPTVTVNRKGTVVLPKEVVASFGLNTGRRVTARRHGAKIILDIVPRPRQKRAGKKAARRRRK